LTTRYKLEVLSTTLTDTFQAGLMALVAAQLCARTRWARPTWWGRGKSSVTTTLCWSRHLDVLP